MEERNFDESDVSLIGSERRLSSRGRFVYVLTFFSAIGGFLFGYDTGVVSGAMIILKDQFHLSNIWQELIISITIGFAAFFALVGGVINSLLGRRGAILIASVIFIAGSLTLALANNKETLLVGRAIVGSGIGIASMTTPVYIAEISPVEIRGRLVTFNNVMITFGQFIASCIDGVFSTNKETGWRFMLGLAAVPAAIQLVGFMFLPESPRWLIGKDRYNEAKEILTKISGDREAAEREFEMVKSTVEKETSSNVPGIVALMKDRGVRRALVVGCILQLIQQFSGINTVMYYSATIVQMSGIRDATTAIWMAAVTAFVNFIFTIVGVILVEKVGRRSLTLGSLAGVVGSLLFLALGFLLSSTHSPSVISHAPVSASDHCYQFSHCSDCMQTSTCGFCYVETNHNITSSWCYPVNSTNQQVAVNGLCDATADKFFATNYCPTKYSWMALAGMIAYLAFFAPGMGPMPWTINAEIYPQWARDTANSYSTATNWISNMVVSLTFLNVTQALTYEGAFLLYACLAAAGFLFLFLFLPETKGKRLEEIESMFQQKWLVPCQKNTNYNSLRSYSVVDEGLSDEE